MIWSAIWDSDQSEVWSGVWSELVHTGSSHINVQIHDFIMQSTFIQITIKYWKISLPFLSQDRSHKTCASDCHCLYRSDVQPLPGNCDPRASSHRTKPRFDVGYAYSRRGYTLNNINIRSDSRELSKLKSMFMHRMVIDRNVQAAITSFNTASCWLSNCVVTKIGAE